MAATSAWYVWLSLGVYTPRELTGLPSGVRVVRRAVLARPGTVHRRRRGLLAPVPVVWLSICDAALWFTKMKPAARAFAEGGFTV